MTPLDKTLKRSLWIGKRAYVIALTPKTLKVTEKGNRLGIELDWTALVSGEAALATALQASISRMGSSEPSLASGRKVAPKRTSGKDLRTLRSKKPKARQ
jgi:hypothetical protein